MSRKAAPASRAQIVALLTLFSRLYKDGDPRVFSPIYRQRDLIIVPGSSSDEREARLDWATAKLGKAGLQSFNDLTGRQAAFLLDCLQGKKSKLDVELDRQWERLEIREPEKWFEAVTSEPCKSRVRPHVFWKFRGLKLYELNRWQKIQLLTLLKTRSPQSREVSLGDLA